MSKAAKTIKVQQIGSPIRRGHTQRETLIGLRLNRICRVAELADTPAVRASAGVSIIWDSPFGPLRFDFAYPFLREGYDRTQFFAFGGGTKF